MNLLRQKSNHRVRSPRVGGKSHRREDVLRTNEGALDVWDSGKATAKRCLLEVRVRCLVGFGGSLACGGRSRVSDVCKKILDELPKRYEGERGTTCEMNGVTM